MRLCTLLQDRASACPDALAYRFLPQGELEHPEVRTYSALARRVAQLAGLLSARTAPGDRVLLLFPPGLGFIEAFVACEHAALLAVPAPPLEAARADRYAPRLRRILEDCSPRLVLGTEAQLTLLRSVVAVPAGTELLGAQAGDHADPVGPVAVDADAPAFLQYTSGSTGSPKGVVVSSRGLHYTLADLSAGFAEEPDPHQVSWLPQFHDMGLIWGLLHPLYAGYPCTFMPPTAFLADPGRWLRALSALRGTRTAAPDFAYRLCEKRVTDLSGLDLRGWAIAMNAAEPVRAKTLDAFVARFGACGFRPEAFCGGYGLAEATVKVSTGCVGQVPDRISVDPVALEQGKILLCEDGAALVSSGVTSLDTGVRIADPQTGLTAAAGRVGEIRVSGPGLALGYYNRPDDTRAAFVTGPDGERELKTGDLGVVVDGSLYVTGRSKELIIVRGRNLYPQDLEATVEEAHPAFRPGCSAAFGVPGPLGEQVVVVAEVRERSLAGEAVREAARALVGSFGIRPVVVAVPPRTVLKTSSGKRRRRAMASSYEQLEEWARSPQSRPGRPAELDTALAEITQLLAEEGIVEVDPDLTFEELGVDSVTAAVLAGRLGLDPIAVFAHPTPRALARHHLAAETSGEITTPAARTGPAGAALGVLGLGVRLPGVDEVDDLIGLCTDATSRIRPLPPHRVEPGGPQPGRLGGWLDDLAGFDCAAFGIQPREAEAMDPQHRLLLEVIWEALADTGFRLDTQRVGVFVGLSNTDWQRRTLQSDAADAQSVVGSSPSLAAGRVAWLLDLHGPAMTLDTACSSGLVALHQAAESIRRGECDLAIVAAANAITSESSTRALERMGALSATGQVAAFAEGADGYVRGEGAVALVLGWSTPERRGRGMLLGSAVGQDGRSNGLTAPTPGAQEAVIRAALANAGLAPERVDLVECHGTGTPLGDPIEIHALSQVYGQARLGALKSQIGHLEAAAGLAGVARALACLQQGTFPPPLPGPPSSRIDWEAIGLRRDGQGSPTVAGVSAFGFSGTNAHVLLGRASSPERRQPEAELQRAPHEDPVCFVAAASSERALRDTGPRWTEWLQAHPEASVSAAAAASWARDPRGPHRAWFRVDGRRLSMPREAPLHARRWALQFTGQGASFSTFLPRDPTFQAGIDAADALLGPLRGRRLRHWLETEGPERAHTAVAQPLMVAVGVALARAWEHRGLPIGAVLGHSVGEISAAIVAGVLTLEHGLELARARGAAMGELPSGGGMLSVGALPKPEALQGLSVAAYNGPRQVVLSGELHRIDAYERRALALGVRCQRLPVSHAFHSPLMAPALETLSGVVERLQLEAPRLPFFSTVEEGALPNEAGYWLRQIEAPVRYEHAVRAMRSQGFDGVIECGPASVLTGLGRRCVGRPTVFVASAPLPEAFAKAWAAGAPVRPASGPGAVGLPSVCWDRTRHWLPMPVSAEAASTPLAGRPPADQVLERVVELDRLPWLQDHGIDGRPVVAGAAFAAILFAVGAVRWPGQALLLEDLRFLRPVPVEAGRLQVVLSAEGHAEIRAADRLVVSGRLGRARSSHAPLSRESELHPIDLETHHDDLASIGIEWGARWRAIEGVEAHQRGARCTLGDTELAIALDSAWSLYAVVSRAAGRPVQGLGAVRPAQVDSLWWSGETPSATEAVVSLEEPALSALHADLYAEDRLLLCARGLRLGGGLRATPSSEPSAFVPGVRTPLSNTIARLVAAKVGQAPESVRGIAFSELGVDSLLLLEIRDELSEILGRDLPVADFFDHPTVDALATHFSGASPARTQPSAGSAGEPIAIVGIGCRFPGGVTDPESFWSLLAEGRDAVTEVPSSRWDVDAWYDPDPAAPGKTVSRQGGFLGALEHFDARFFGIAPREAELLDPQGRLLLECSWEAIERAGWRPEELEHTGVYVGISGTDYHRHVLQSAERIGPWSVLDTVHSGIVGRLSYWLGLRGPNLPVDTACSSALVALHLARQALQTGDCDRALVGGTNVQLEPDISVYFSKLGALSPSGRCRPFGAGADGYVRAEGCGVVALRRLSDALKDGDPVLAVIRGTAVNQDGRSNGFTAPHGPSQQAVIRAAQASAGVTPDQVGYVEAHGTGTPLGDPVEAGALGQVFAGRDAPLPIGSVKSNFGHSEAAAGMAGLIKTVLCLQHGELVKSLHAECLSPEVDWESLPVRVVREGAPWTGPRIAGLSSFGFSGTNAHAIVAAGPDEPLAPHPIPGEGPWSVRITAVSERSLSWLAQRWADALEQSPVSVRDVAYTAARTRSHHPIGVTLEASDLGTLVRALREVAAGSRPQSTSAQVPVDGRIVSLPTYPYDRRRYWFGDTRERAWTSSWCPIAAPVPSERATSLVPSRGRLAAALEGLDHPGGLRIALAEGTSSPDREEPVDWIVTVGVFAVRPSEPPAMAAAQAVRSARDRGIGVLDLPPGASPDTARAAIQALPAAPDLLAVRDGEWFALRWEPAPAGDPPEDCVVVVAIGGELPAVEAALDPVPSVHRLDPLEPGVSVARHLADAVGKRPHEIWVCLGPDADPEALSAWSGLLARSARSRGPARWRILSGPGQHALGVGEAAHLRSRGVKAMAFRCSPAFDADLWAWRDLTEILIAAEPPYAAPRSVAVDLACLAPAEQALRLRSWLRERVGRELGLTPEALPLDTPLVELGLDSVIAAELIEDLRRWCGVRLTVADVMARPGINAVIDGVVPPAARATPASRPARTA